MKKILLTSLAVAVAATPALAHRVTDGPADQKRGPGHEHPAKAKAKKAKGPKGALHLLHACVVADVADPAAATAELELHVLQGNRHMKRFLARELTDPTTYTAALDGETRIRLVGRARHLPAGSSPKRLPRLGGFEHLTAGDQVMVRFRASRRADDLGAAFSVIDRGPTKKCASALAPPAEEPPPAPEL